MSSEVTLTAPQSGRSATGAPAAPWALTVVHHRDVARCGARVSLGGGLVLGRGAETLGGALDDRSVSRRHAELVVQDDRVVLRDLGSRNGTRVDGRPVPDVALGEGAVVRLGEVLLLLHRPPTAFDRPDCPDALVTGPALADVLVQAAVVAGRKTPVLVLGETGVGKELVAREVHRRSGRSGPFVAVNCGAMTDSVLQSELFGHARGAYSGADRQRPGLVASAEGGTLFLDEIGDASDALQVSLLRLLQEGEYRPVGSDRTLAADVRVVAATLRDLPAHVESGRFRPDLWMRLSRWVLTVPPLRARREEILPLARHFARRHGPRDSAVAIDLAEALLLHRWPGNVRELDAVMERLVVTAGAATLLAMPSWFVPMPETPVREAQAGDASGRETQARVASPEVADLSPSAAARGEARAVAPPRAPRARPSPEELAVALRRLGGNVRALAAELGIGRATLYRWFDDAGLSPDDLR